MLQRVPTSDTRSDSRRLPLTLFTLSGCRVAKACHSLSGVHALGGELPDKVYADLGSL